MQTASWEKRAIAGLGATLVLLSGIVSSVQAQRVTLSATPTISETPTPTPQPTQRPQDLTQPKGETKSRLERVLEEQHPGPLTITTIFQHAIRQGVAQGVPLNTIVLLLLFPVVATLIAAARHIVGLRGFGVFTPAVIAVTLLATGIRLGLTLFVSILLIAMGGRAVIRYLRLQYLPQMAQLILVMCLGVLGIFLVSPTLTFLTGSTLGFDRLVSVGIFPILLFTLLTETFISAQIQHGVKHAGRMTIETLVLASASFLLMNMPDIQEWVVTRPELTVLGVATINVAIGRFTGLRILEYWRFRELLRK